jgi:hypothetical protein
MTVTITKASDGRTLITAKHMAYVAGEQRFRLYPPDYNGSNAIDSGHVGGVDDLVWSFYIEDEPKRFIEPYPNQSQGTFSIAREERYSIPFIGMSDWAEKEKQSYTYQIYANAYTRPTISMIITPTAQSNGYNMVGTTAIQASFSGSGKYGAGISSYTLNVEGKNYGAPYKSDVLVNGGWQTVTGTITDTRGLTTSVSEKIWVMSNMPSLDSVSAGTKYLDSVIKFKITPPNQDAYSSIQIASKVNGDYQNLVKVDLGQGGGEKTYTLTSELASAYKRYPNSTEVPLRMTLLTYKGAYTDKLSEEYSKDLTLYIPQNNDTKPQITSKSAVAVPKLFNTEALFVKGKNAAKVSAEGSAKYDATVKNIEWVVENETFANGVTSDFFESAGSKAIKVKITDSRGFTNEAEIPITVYDYSKPNISPIENGGTIVVKRVDASGDTADNGTYLRVEAKKVWSSIGGMNTCALLFRKKVTGASGWGDYKTLLDYNSSSSDYKGTLGEDLDPQTLYTIELSVLDGLNESNVYNVYIATEKVFMDRSGTRGSIAFGGHVSEDEAFEVYQDAYFRGGIIIDDVATGKRYRLVISEDGTLKATLDNSTFNLRR